MEQAACAVATRLKKAGQTPLMSYRPFSNLSVISKLLKVLCVVSCQHIFSLRHYYGLTTRPRRPYCKSYPTYSKLLTKETSPFSSYLTATFNSINHFMTSCFSLIIPDPVALSMFD